MNRRDFLLLRIARDEVAELSCERLFMRFVDGVAEGNTGRLFDATRRRSRRAHGS